jgi:hypothetical protein
MEDTDARDQLALLSARVLAIRDVVARLVAYEANRWPDPNKLLRDFSEAVDARLHSLPPNDDNSMMTLHETIRREVDWIVEAAQSVLRPDEKGSS